MNSSATLERVLFVDDEPKILKALTRACRAERYEVLTATSPDDALAIMAEAPIAVVVSDQEMPGSCGTAFLARVRQLFPETIRILLTGSSELRIAADAVNEAGIHRLLTKPWDDAVFLETIRSALQAHAHSEPGLRRACLDTIRALVEAVDAKDAYTRGHSERVAVFASRIALQLGVSRSCAEQIYLAGLLHDVGKIGVPDAILGKPTRLTREEHAQIRRHPVVGARILEPVALLRGIVPAVRHHHEWFDGSTRGYPDQLSGSEIPYASRVILVADTIEAMTADRPYRRAVSLADAATELVRFRGSQFDPEVTDAFLALFEDEGDEFLSHSAKFDVSGFLGGGF